MASTVPGQEVPFEPPFPAAMFSGAIDSLELDDPVVAELSIVLHEEFLSRFNREAARARARISTIQRERQRRQREDTSVVVLSDRLVEAEQEWLANSQGLQQQLFTDVQQLLGPELAKRWQVTIRRMQRPALLENVQRVAGVRWSVDLRLALIDANIELGPIETLIEKYETAVDAVLRRFSEGPYFVALRQYHDQLARRALDPAGDWEDVVSRGYERCVEFADAVELLNQQTFDQFLGATTSMGRARFRQVVMGEVFPAVYTASPVELIQPFIAELDVLSSEDRDELNEVLRDYPDQEDRIRIRIVAALRRWGSISEREKRRTRYRRLRAEGGDLYEVERAHFALPLWQDQNHLVLTTLRAVKDVLGEYPVDALPVPVRVVLNSVS